MRTRIITGYVPIPGHPRTAAEYGELGEKLSGVPVPKKAFYMRVEDTWLHRYITDLKFPVNVSQYDNSAKNTLAYHCVNHMKSSWLAQAADEYPDDDVFVWVDYGIFRLPGVTNQAIYEFLEKLDDRCIYAPGCWNNHNPVESVFPCWRFVGSMIAVPKRYVDQFDSACRETARQHIQRTHNVEWEVNTWARVEQKRKFKIPFHWYPADHNVSMFTDFENPHAVQ